MNDTGDMFQYILRCACLTENGAGYIGLQSFIRHFVLGPVPIHGHALQRNVVSMETHGADTHRRHLFLQSLEAYIAEAHDDTFFAHRES